MKALTVALATTLTLLALIHSSHSYVSPHPKFPDIDCDGFRGTFKKCNPVVPNYSDRTQDQRVCIEYRIKESSHCQMMNNHCNRLRQKFNLIGTCHKSFERSHHKKYPYMKCYNEANKAKEIQYYCSPKDQDKVCGAFMKSYESECDFLYDYCNNIEPTYNAAAREKGDELPWQVAKILMPKLHEDMFLKHKYYDKCGMYSPLAGHNKKDFKDVYPELKLDESHSAKYLFNHNVRQHIFKYDHVCTNQGEQKFKHKNMTDITPNSYTLRQAHSLQFKLASNNQYKKVPQDSPLNANCKTINSESVKDD